MRMVVVKMNEDGGYGRDERTVMSKTSERNFQFFFFENREILCVCVRVSVLGKRWKTPCLYILENFSMCVVHVYLGKFIHFFQFCLYFFIISVFRFFFDNNTPVNQRTEQQPNSSLASKTRIHISANRQKQINKMFAGKFSELIMTRM